MLHWPQITILTTGDPGIVRHAVGYIALVDFFKTQPVFTLFLVLALGHILGRLRAGPISLGPVAGVLFVGLFFGHLGLTMSPGAQAVGFALFIFTVGYQAGPRFFEVLREDGARYLALATIVAGIGVAIAATAASIGGLEFGSVAGLLAGGLTSSPTLAAAQEGLRNGNVPLPPGITVDQAIDNVVTGYAITYIFGLSGLIVIVKVLPRLLGIDLAAAAREVAGSGTDRTDTTDSIIVFRAWRVTDPAVAAMAPEELAQLWDGFSSVRIKRDGETHLFRDLGRLQVGDEVLAHGDVRFMGRLQDIGEEVTAEWLDEARTESARIVVSNPKETGKTLQELELPQRFGLYVDRVWRSGKVIPRQPGTSIERGDVLDVNGYPAGIEDAAEALGDAERRSFETDLLAVSLAIAAGAILGTLTVSVLGTSIGLGSAGGLLLAGILLGLAHNIRPTFARVPEGARMLLMDIGLLIFMTGVGLRAGGSILESVQASGLPLILAGVAVTFIPLLTGLAIAIRLLRFNPAIAFGAITGAMTSGAALSVVCKEANSNVPALGYTGTYAFANVLLTIAGTVVLSLA
jgi:putative transport protein